MTLEIFLWAIPAASLTAASILIALRAWRLTRDSLVGKALLLRAANLAPEAVSEEDSVPIPIIELSAANERPDSSTPASLPAVNGRLCPIPIILVARRGTETALAS